MCYTDLINGGAAMSITLPSYDQIPNVGLYLEQTVKYINTYFDSFESMNLTASMVSNYVKKGLVANAVKKQYYREQIAYLFFIAVAKNVLSMENLSLFIQIQKESYTVKKAYDYFCAELENMLHYTFGLKEEVEDIGTTDTEQRKILQSITIPNSVTTIGMAAFWWCTSLESIDIPDSVNTIEQMAFGVCTSLKSVTLPKNLERIRFRCFMHTGLEIVTIPASVKAIKADAFSTCEKLDNICFAGTTEQWQQIALEDSWCNSNTPAKIVHCTDGDIVFVKQ